MALIELTTGPGKPGLKTQPLRADKKSILASGLQCLDSAAVTPGFFRRFLSDSGAFDVKYPEQQQKKVLAHDFSKEEKEAIFETAGSAIHSRFATIPLMVRADDYPLGLGLTKSIPVTVCSDRDDYDGNANKAERELFASRLFAAVKEVLASGFSREMQLFKRIMGVDSAIGVLMSPLLSDTVLDGQFAPQLSLNYIGKSRGQSLYSYGAGIGGANNMEYVVGSTVSSYFPVRAIIEHQAHFGSAPIVLDRRTSRTDIADRKRNSCFLGGEVGRLEFEALEKIGGSIETFINSTGPRYLELVKPRLFYPDCYVVQSAPIAIPEPQKPQVGGKAAIFETSFVLGSGVAHPSAVRVAESEPSKEDARFNMENKGYLLIVKVRMHKDFFDHWRLYHYSNAAAIVLDVENTGSFYGTLHSHLGGPVRALGIPALACDMDGGTIAKLAKNPGTQTTVFADEFGGRYGSEGFLAIE